MQGVLHFLSVFFVCFESYFLQYSSEKSQSWQECRQVTHHSCRVNKVKPCCYLALVVTTVCCSLLVRSAKFY